MGGVLALTAYNTAAASPCADDGVPGVSWRADCVAAVVSVLAKQGGSSRSRASFEFMASFEYIGHHPRRVTGGLAPTLKKKH